MAKTKKRIRTAHITVAQFKTRLKDGHYSSLVGCKRAITRMVLSDTEAATAMRAARAKFPGER